MTATMVGVLLSAGTVPALAGNCSSHGCGVVKNNSRFPLLIADWCSNVCGQVKVVMPGEVSTKYKADTDVFALQCYGVYVIEYTGITRSANAYQWERIYDGQVADVRYQAC
jgi:hypothetical protein